MIRFYVLVIGLVAFILLMLGLPFIQQGVAIGENITPFTANTTHWEGFTEVVAITPWVLIVLLVAMIGYAFWHGR